MRKLLLFLMQKLSVRLSFAVFQVDPNDPNYDSDSTEPKGPSANGTKRTIKLNTMVNKFHMEKNHYTSTPPFLYWWGLLWIWFWRQKRSTISKKVNNNHCMVTISHVGMVQLWNSQVPEMSEEDIRKAVEPLLLEYFDNGDCDEVFLRIAYLKIILLF